MFAEPAASKNWPGLTLRPCAVWSWLIASTLLIIIYRVWSVQFPWLSNSSPLMALCFGGGLLLGRRFWWVPVLLVLSSDFCVGLINGGYGIGSYTAMSAALFCGAAWAGSRLGAWSGRNGLTLWGGTMLCSLVFYAAANTFNWAIDPAYPRSWAGWWQSQTTGLPLYAPSWTFLRNALAGDSVWCLLATMVFSYRGFQSKSEAPCQSAR